MNTMLQPTKKLRSRNIQTSTCLIPDNEREKMQNATVKSEHLFLPNHTFALCLQKA